MWWLALFWVVCGVLTYGLALADFRGWFPARNSKRNFYEDRNLALILGVFGPLGLIGTFIATDGWCMHGLLFQWSYREESDDFT